MSDLLRVSRDPVSGFWYLPAADADVLGISAFMQGLLASTNSNAALSTLTATRSEAGAVAVSVLELLRNRLTFEQFGAAGDGSTDDTVAMQAAIDAAELIANSTGSCILHGSPGKIYKTTGVLLVNSNGVVLDFQGAKLKPTGSSSYNAIAFQGTGLGTTTDVTADAALGALSITVSSTANAAVGDYLYVQEVNGSLSWILIARVLTEVGSVWGLDTPLPFSITAAAGPQVVGKWTPIERVGLRNVEIDCASWTGTNCEALDVQDVAYGVFRDIKIIGNDVGFGLQSFRGYRNHYSNIQAFGAGGGTDNDADIQIGRETMSTISGIKSVNARDFGPIMVLLSYCSIDDVQSIATSARGFKLQQSTMNNLNGLSVIGAGTTGAGFDVGTQHNSISNVSVIKAGVSNSAGSEYGVWLDSASNNNNVFSNVVSLTNDEFDLIVQSTSTGNMFSNVRVTSEAKISMASGNHITGGLNGAPGVLMTDDGAGGGPQFRLKRLSANPASLDVLGFIPFVGQNASGTDINYAQILGRILDATAGSEDSEFDINTYVAGTLASRMLVGNGVQVGAPTGGYKGAGTINAAGDVYKNNSAYANPDYVLEWWKRGKIKQFADRPGAGDYAGPMSLEDLDKFIDEHLHLPRISRDPSGLFERSDMILEKIEELFYHLIQINRRLRDVENA